MQKLVKPILFTVFLFSTLAVAKDSQKVVNQYINMQEKLASDITLSKEDRDNFITLASKTKDQKLKASSKKLSGENSIETQRKVFKEISENIINYAKSNKIKGLFKAHCPMAKASWLQTKKEVANPYYGAKMKRCGVSEKL